MAHQAIEMHEKFNWQKEREKKLKSEFLKQYDISLGKGIAKNITAIACILKELYSGRIN